MLFWKPMTVQDLEAWWEGIDGSTPIPKNELAQKGKKRSQFDSTDEVIYALIPNQGFGAHAAKEFENFKRVILEDKFRAHKASESTTDYNRMINEHLVRVFHVVDSSSPGNKKKEYYIIDSNKLSLLERVFPLRYLNQRWYGPNAKQKYAEAEE